MNSVVLRLLFRYSTTSSAASTTRKLEELGVVMETASTLSARNYCILSKDVGFWKADRRDQPPAKTGRLFYTSKYTRTSRWSSCWSPAVIVAAGGSLLLALYLKRSGRLFMAEEVEDRSSWRPRYFSFVDFPEVLAAQPFSNAEPSEDGDKMKSLRASNRFNFIADVVENAAPAVVNIEIQGRDPFRRGNNVTVSNGSGFIVSEDGLILTNAHVVGHQAHVLIKLHDGRSFEGTVDQVDYVSDLATVRINCKALPTLKLGTSADLRPGEFVVAMGSPLSLSNTITAGVVSSVHRESAELGLGHKNMEYIQTDASITFGNSGGPLVNLDGEVIGINSMKVTAGISFAIPADYAKEFLENAKKGSQGRSWFGGKSVSSEVAKRRYIGVTMLTLTPSIVQELQQRQPDFPASVTHGVFIWRVIVGSPAHNGGLQPGDIIVGINGGDVKSASDVYRALESGTELRLVVMRRNKTLALTVVPQD